MTKNNSILIKGARVNNLKNIDVEIPRNKLVVITGLSGSGKSSLAFDTLYAEGQRRYVESLSSYARQFLGRMSKPECDFIKGIPPAIAIEQKVSSRNPRSTVGTSTEIYEYLRLLYARIGRTFSPISGEEVKKHSTEDIVNCMLGYPEGTRYTVLAPILLREDRTMKQQLDIDMKQGFNRLEVNGEMIRIDEYEPKKGDTVFLLTDRMVASKEKDAISRLTDSAETAMYEGDGACLLRFYQPDGTITVEMQFMADLVLECETCHGKRFKADTLEVKFHDANIYDVLEMTVNQAIEFFTKHGQKKIVKKLAPLQDVGLGYIKLGQSSSTLSGGENQRVKLAYYLSQEKADPTLFIFDEPTTGLHFHDIRKLLEAFDALILRGHSIVIIEHNMDVIKCADYVIDLGPEGGDKGGNLVAAGTPEEVAKCAASYTGQFLQEKLHMK